MNLEISLKRINALMSHFVTEIKGEASMGRTDFNKAAETILIPLLNEIYTWNLKNINYSENNNSYPAIDLADKAAKVSIQVTATADSEKIKHTVNQFIKHEQYLEYSRLIVYILAERKSSYPDKTIQKIIQGKFNFDTRTDIWDYRDILKEVSHFQIDRALKVQKILEANFSEDEKLTSLIANSLEQRIDWREICRELLSHWKGLTTNALTKPNGVRFQLNEIFVPLGVVERREKPKHRSNDGSPAEQGSELYEEKITPISQDDFFEQVLRQGQSRHSQGSRIAIIGEPGAGKTTQLQKIGDWILEETDGIPIWIPLTALGTRKLKDYLLNDWLQTAIEELEVSQEHRDALGQLLKTGKVWLLLDGVDEMAISDALYQIDTQMREGWLRNVRVVLTCRLNVWDVSKNALDGFDVYRNLNFEYPSEVHQFIDKWFATEPGLQQKLKVALEQPGKERIRDMVKNPLRLTLLCYSWQLRQGELPETKAGLFEWFMDAFYEWNKGKIPTKLNSTNRKELNAALGELAKQAIDQESSRFRLREKFINQFLGAADDEDSLFYLALQLGWLNRVGVAEENPLEDVYAFFHPTFQEYFAALAIDDYHFLLNHISENPNHPDASYRIFESQWREVFLLWLGRENISKKDREGLIEALIEFDDECSNFYQYRAYCLAASGISEFFECSFKVSILEQVITWYLGYFHFNLENRRWILFLNPNPIDNLVELTLQETNRDALIDAMIALITKNLNNSICRGAARSLGRFGSNNSKAIQALVSLVQNNLDREVRQQAVESLGEISSKVPEVIDVLNSHLLNSQNKEEQLQTAKSLGKLSPGNSSAVKVLVEALLSSEDSFDSKQISWVLREIDIDKIAVANIVKLLATSQSESEREFLDRKLVYIDCGNSEATNDLRRILRDNCDDETKFKAAVSLLEIDSKDFDAISILISLLQNTQDIEIKKQIIGGLGILVTDSSDAVDALSSLLYLEQDETILILASEMLRQVGFGNRNAILALTQLIQAKQGSKLQYHYAWCLSEIDLGNPEAIIPFVKLLEAEKDDEYKTYAINMLSNMGALESSIIRNKLSDLLNNSQSQRVHLESAWNLWLCSAYNRDLIYTLLSDQLFSSKDEETCRLAAWRLKGILQDELFHNTVAQLAEVLSITVCKQYLGFHRIYFNLAAFCMQKMPYLDFYKAWYDGLNR